MANPVFSPNDPLFWVHHAQVDRVWSRWQEKRRAEGASLISIYPPPNEPSPINGQVPPNGHRRDDFMWPWVGTSPGYSVNASAAVQAMLPSFAGAPTRRIRDVFDLTNLGGGLGGNQYA